MRYALKYKLGNVSQRKNSVGFFFLICFLQTNLFFQNLLKVKNNLKLKFLLDHRDTLYVFERQRSRVIKLLLLCVCVHTRMHTHAYLLRRCVLHTVSCHEICYQPSPHPGPFHHPGHSVIKGNDETGDISVTSQKGPVIPSH